MTDALSESHRESRARNRNRTSSPPEVEQAPQGYHKRRIPRGTWREFSKIEEEFWEAKDAHEQGVKIMLLTELSDLYGAIKGFLEKHHPGTTMDDLRLMNERTAAAFQSGTRVERPASPGRQIDLMEGNRG